MRGKVSYQGSANSQIALNLTYTKPFDHPSGKGYQRPVNKQRCVDFANYLSFGDDSLFTPILLNAGGNWEFHPYDNHRVSFGRLICKNKASLLDGQHRLGGIQQYLKETNSVINIPFLAFHWLDEDEEIKFFNTINSKAKGIGTSLSRYLNRDSDEYSWIGTQLILKTESPFFSKGTLTGKRGRGKHITLQNLYKALHLLSKNSELESMPKEKLFSLALLYFGAIKDTLPDEWDDYKTYRLTHIVCLDALAIAGNKLLNKSYSIRTHQINSAQVLRAVHQLKQIDWSKNGNLKYLKGISGSKMLSEELITCMNI
jgi:DNA sulfur modification protein DndB